jgi:hypothetical protein
MNLIYVLVTVDWPFGLYLALKTELSAENKISRFFVSLVIRG